MVRLNERWKSDIDRIRLITMIAFIMIITAMAWQSDDAYHGYVMAKHLVEGDGLVYNIGERATASSCPLFTLIIGAGYFVTRQMFYTSIFISVAFSSGAYYILCKYFCKSVRQIILSFFILCGSFSFISYTTSGLENCLLFFLAALFLKLFFQTERYTAKQLLYLGLLISAIAMTRMDGVLMFVPMVVFAYLFRRDKVSFPKAVIIGMLALTPFLLWLLFSLFYYGFPFPNTAYVKLGTQIPQKEYYIRGIQYYFVTAINDVLVLLLPFSFCITALWRKKLQYIWGAAGIVLYGLYVLHIGGDFMVGRHFTVMFFMSLCFFAKMDEEWNTMEKGNRVRMAFTTLAMGGILFTLTIPSAIGNQYLFGHEKSWPIADERRFYFPNTSLFNNLGQNMKEGKVIRAAWNEQGIEELRSIGENGGILPFVPGISIYYNSDMYLNDQYALGDPFLSKLPAIRQENWRIGHMQREVPEGYKETVQTGVNVIVNKDLREYYDKILLITRGELWDKERIETILNMNLGKYDYLIENYKATLDN
ncbi:hypothetical protein D7X25_30495 [bacterium 1XD42-8]|jgi:arabinofuranosyltransferase|nr:hypothetical protein [Lachnospiraceae bacterium]RKJ38447.1 hypothetical protein D7X25_30495 [bacterium 1XD42-8]